jgi:Cft2 family RNA processing exonuclease
MKGSNMQISDEIINAVTPKDTKRITYRALAKLGLCHIYRTKYVIEDVELFQKNFWPCLTDQQKFSLLLSEISEHREEINDLSNSVVNLENKMNNLRLAFE